MPNEELNAISIVFLVVQSRATSSSSSRVTAQLELKAPPYPLDALEPYMSQKTLEFHWGKHHRGYVDNLNKQIAGTDLDGLTLEEIVVKSYNNGSPLPLSTMPPRHGAPIWNHDFLWTSIKPGGGGKPSGLLLELIERDFGSVDALLSEFKQAALTQFGSGWAWLGYRAGKLVVEKTANAVNPLVSDYTPLLVVDVWEHAYYLDYQNRRPDFVSTFIEKLISWDAVSARLDEAIAASKSA
ncbi:unnamed protein product [Spirodela intermedia]|uniref:Superoxide dismutase n=1 Tax=Spirodela intermedia TaxID=51605 RepID=A0A7I8JUI5_SPIIN|nr:unnamed protein product [Spirodela intermedia]CAA6673846.1 unnamed protein product [Spirodela intermedia]